MADFILMSHGDGRDALADWPAYLEKLGALGVLRGGSAMGGGETFRRAGSPGDLSAQLTGFIRVEVADFEAAKGLLAGHPTYEAGGTVEIRALPRTD